MNKKATTKDELFLLKLYDLASDSEIDRYIIGRAIGQNDKGVDNIVKNLAAANFIKKGSHNSIYLTPHGIKLVQFLLTERY